MSVKGAALFALRFTSHMVSSLSSAMIAAHILHTIEGRRTYTTKEGNMPDRTFNAESLNLAHLSPIRVSYEPKNIRTEAIQVGIENIGKLSLEFEAEMFHDSQGRPYFVFLAERLQSSLDTIDGSSELYVRLTDWIVPLRGELHVMRDVIFQSTFMFDFPSEGLHVTKPALARPYVDEQPVISLNTPMNVPKVALSYQPDRIFRVDDRVYVDATGDYGVVTVVDIEIDEKSGVEVKLDNGQYLPFLPGDIQHARFEGEVEKNR